MKHVWCIAACMALMTACAEKQHGTSAVYRNNSVPRASEQSLTHPNASPASNGTAPGSSEKSAAGPALGSASGTPGGIGFQQGSGNKTEAAPSPTPARGDSPLDKALKSKVQAALNSGEISGVSSAATANIQVFADRGVVTLKGQVSSDKEKQIITDHLHTLDGVTIVKNELTVGLSSRNAQGNPGTNESGTDGSGQH